MRSLLIPVAAAAAATLAAAVPLSAQRLPASTGQLMARFDSIASHEFDVDHWHKRGNPGMGTLRPGATDTTDIQLPSNTRFVALGLCTGCTGLTMQVFGPSGTKLGEDVRPGAAPRVEFTTGSALARYKIFMQMAACSQPQCDIGLQLMHYR